MGMSAKLYTWRNWSRNPQDPDVKKLLTIVLIVGIGTVLFFRSYWSRITNDLPIPTPISGAKPQSIITPSASLKTIEYDTVVYAYDFINTSIQHLSLIPNFDKLVDSSTLMESSGCRMGTNAGFYTTEKTPLGLVIINGETINRSVKSSLFNGYISIRDAKPEISYSVPDNSVTLAVQTGPMLIFNHSILPLAIRNDEQARRISAATLDDDSVVFIVVYDPDASYNGPLLSQLSNIIDAIAQKERLNIVNAINLDGGSHSFFKSDTTTLSELSPIGALFCIK